LRCIQFFDLFRRRQIIAISFHSLYLQLGRLKIL
jgi:hypothetical protein